MGDGNAGSLMVATRRTLLFAPLSSVPAARFLIWALRKEKRAALAAVLRVTMVVEVPVR